MAKYSIPQAKNFVSRCLRNIVDPVPTAKQRNEVWEYFANKCAYCGHEMSPKDRIGHLDHVIPTSEGGTNHISNFVLSCPQCNGDDKRETDWVQFLSKQASSEVFERRKQRIQAWLDRAKENQRRLSAEDIATLNEVTEEVKEAISKAAEQLKALRG